MWPELREYKRVKSLRRQIIVYFQLRLLAVISVIFSHAVLLSNRFHISLYLYVCYMYIHISIHIYLKSVFACFISLEHTLTHTHTHAHKPFTWKNGRIPCFLNTYLKGKDQLVLCILLDQFLIAKCPISIYLLLFTEEWIHVILLSYSCILKLPNIHTYK